jgi:heme/copper-type cytochrome/quinol oxidase subunit 2
MWVGLIAAILLVVVINVALFGVIRRFKASRGAEPRQLAGARHFQVPVAAVLTALALAIFLVSVVLTDQARETPGTQDNGLISKTTGKPQKQLSIKATGQQWLWRYDYPNGAFSYYKLVVPANTPVDLELVSTDVVHTWDVGDIAGKADAVPDKINHVVFRADETGNYYGASATLSGQAYAAMRTEVEVVPPDEYEAWVKEEKKEIETAQEAVVGEQENGEVP